MCLFHKPLSAFLQTNCDFETAIRPNWLFFVGTLSKLNEHDLLQIAVIFMVYTLIEHTPEPVTAREFRP